MAQMTVSDEFLAGAPRMSLERYAALVEEAAPEREGRTVCDCGALATECYFGRMFCRSCVDFMEAQRGPRCETCRDEGRIPVPGSGNSEIWQSCPDCEAY